MEEFTGQAGMCLVDADAIPTLGAALAHRQNSAILANRIALDGGAAASVGCRQARQGVSTGPLDDVWSTRSALLLQHSFGYYSIHRCIQRH
ncbi:uncharacterized protein N7496_003937 [Penicillium cataractarum]|uniref:Uncharacterized protein n=1 Tax=Penicillium cataractarum TaxID=2100454 RepID=A0A9W9SPK5_9EURO|nr:uncharacterized protein N7496_003937 [Penicillium cataractarum]KAJ5381509.1 hypothetical protein N7496_003937 [Penicillium cataractarum]